MPRKNLVSKEENAAGAVSRPTLRTVAAEAGLAVTTVSRALAEDPRIAEATRKRVADVASKQGYVPNRAAQRLRTGRTKVISLLLNTRHEFLSFTSEFLGGMSEGLQGTGYAFNITADSLGGDRLDAIRQIRRHALADAIVFTRTECFDDRVRYLLEHDFPFVSHGRTDFTTPHPFVDFDNEAFVRLAIERLVQKGRQHICIVMPNERYTFGQHLRFGARQAVISCGARLTIPEGVDLDSEPDEIAATLRALHAGPDAPDGYVCVGEVMALITLAGLNDMGLTPGQEVDLVAKRASPISNHFRPRIETVDEDLRATGRAMAEVLLARIDGRPMEEMQVLLKPQGPFSISG
ncbi:LacI family transcriptional regulator (plasmid) [Roseibium porphyridii]|uniref:LacI family transcriptional regulator n=1 Tax=Roseibium porphyridii TaxID=2866279 RepID=A0ABY8FAY6_9HYPH|nr:MULTISPECIES: LacI family transcriptional regulator [Stappiaceae]QFT29886.1 HTH-type transcriptional regulator RafR [Labrenzia sp. THAF82]WFE92617.1 LacI family transcriptional regulator [Roseibium sp. KMA01]